MTHFTCLSQNSVFRINNSNFITQIFSHSNVIIFLTGSMKLLASLSFFPAVQFCLFPGGSLLCKNMSYFTRTNDQASYRHGLELHLVMGNDTGSVYILNYSFASRWLCALASLGVGSGFLALAFSLLSMVGRGPGVRGLFSGVPRVLRWRKIFKPVKT